MASRRMLPYFLSNVKTPSEIDRLHSIFRTTRSRIFVGGLTLDYDDTNLKRSFSEFGEIAEAEVVVDRNSGLSRGFGFVTFTNLSSASSAVASMDGLVVQGRPLRVRLTTGL